MILDLRRATLTKIISESEKTKNKDLARILGDFTFDVFVDG